MDFLVYISINLSVVKLYVVIVVAFLSWRSNLLFYPMPVPFESLLVLHEHKLFLGLVNVVQLCVYLCKNLDKEPVTDKNNFISICEFVPQISLHTTFYYNMRKDKAYHLQVNVCFCLRANNNKTPWRLLTTWTWSFFTRPFVLNFKGLMSINVSKFPWNELKVEQHI